METKVLVMGFNVGMGGVQSYLMNLIRYIDRTKIKFDYIVPGENTVYENEISSLGGKVYYVTPQKTNVFKNLYETFRILKNNKSKYDIIYFNHSLLYFIFPFLFAHLLGYKKILSHAHSAGPSNPPQNLRYGLHNFNKRIVVKYSDYLLTCSNEATRWGLGDSKKFDKKVQLIPNGINVEKFRFKIDTRSQYRNYYNLDKETIVLGTVGRLSEEKNHKFLIDIFEKFLLLNPDSKLFIVGDGPEKDRLFEIISEKKLTESVKLFGSRSDISEFLHMFDVFILPSHYEGLGISLIEAQASGLLCFASKDKVPESVNLTGNVIYLDLDCLSPNEWAKEIDQSLKKFNRTDKSEDIYSAGYDIESVTNEFEEYILKIE